MQGTVKFFNNAKGYGFVTDDEPKKDYFLHGTGIKHKIKNNDKVTFEVGKGKQDAMAVQVKIAQ